MEAVAGVTQRIWEIQSRIAQLRAPSVSFDTVLGEAVQSVSAGSLATAASTPTTDVGSGASLVDSDGIPVELKAYGNGRVPASALSAINGTSQMLWTPAARSFEAMQAAAAAEGVTIGVTDSYRTYESQVDLVARKGLYSQGGLAATPGTSKHGWGIAVDLSLDSTAQAWMRANAGRYGFVENVSREPWHWQYKPTH